MNRYLKTNYIFVLIYLKIFLRSRKQVRTRIRASSNFFNLATLEPETETSCNKNSIVPVRSHAGDSDLCEHENNRHDDEDAKHTSTIFNMNA